MDAALVDVGISPFHDFSPKIILHGRSLKEGARSVTATMLIVRVGWTH